MILVSIIAYGLLCGMDSSVVRAVLMGSLSLIALFRGREIPIWRLLSIAMILMLVYNPYFLVYDLGFLLSFAAVASLALFTQTQAKTHKPGRIKSVLFFVRRSYLYPSMVASVGVFPIIILRTGKMNMLSLLGNLLVLPLVPFVMIYGAISPMVYSIFHRHRII